MKKEKNIKYLDAITKLETIMEELQTDNVDVDILSLKVKEAIDLIQLCKGKIKSAELKVKSILDTKEIN